MAHGKLNVKQKWTETPPSENGGKKARKVVLTQGSPRSWGGAIPFVVSRRSACVDFKPRLSKRKKISGRHFGIGIGRRGKCWIGWAVSPCLLRRVRMRSREDRRQGRALVGVGLVAIRHRCSTMRAGACAMAARGYQHVRGCVARPWQWAMGTVLCRWRFV